MSRYARQMQLPQVGAEGQARLQGAHVLIIGAGGLAATAAALLAGAGIGQITLIDPDRVELSNLHRQIMFHESDVGHYKAKQLARRLAGLNEQCAVSALCETLTSLNAPQLIASVDVVVDCADSYAVSYLASDLCYKMDKPLISASVLGSSGYVGGYCGGAPSLRALFPSAPDNGASCASAGVFGPVVAMLGAAQAQMVLSVLLDHAPSPLGQVMQFLIQEWRSQSFRFDGAPEPERRFAFVHPRQLTKSDLIVELRGEGEAPEPLHPDALRVLPEAIDQSYTRIAFCCASGLRSWRAAEALAQTEPREIVLLAASITEHL